MLCKSFGKHAGLVGKILKICKSQISSKIDLCWPQMHQNETKSSRSRAAVGGPLGEPGGRVFYFIIWARACLIKRKPSCTSKYILSLMYLDKIA